MRLKVLIVLTLIFNVLFCSHSKTSPSHLRALQNSKEERACSLLIAIDELLFNHYQRNFTRITNLVQVLVTGANDIYAKDIFLGQFEGIYFRVKEIRLLFNFCPHCNQTARNFLDTFALMDFSDFCLAHLLTYRDFPDGLQGMAHRGALCSRNQNTGFTSLLNHGVRSILIVKPLIDDDMFFIIRNHVMFKMDDESTLHFMNHISSYYFLKLI